MPKKVETKQIEELLRRGIKNEPIKSYNDLIDRLKKLGVKPGEAYRIINEKKHSTEEGNIRFNWKMIRFTFFVWARIKEHKRGYLKPKIDTVRDIIKNDRRFYHFFNGYYPDFIFDPDREIKLLNKLIAEKPQQQFLKEGYYKYEGTKETIPQKHLDLNLSPKK